MVEMSPFAQSVYLSKYSMNQQERWEDTAERVASNVMGVIGIDYRPVQGFITERKFLPGGRYLYASGRDLHQTNNCLLMKAEDSREGWAKLIENAAMALMTGAGIGIDYSDVRENGAVISKTGGIASGPISLMKIINEIGRNVMQGGSRRSAIWAGLSWQHPDIIDFIFLKDWSPEVKELKSKDFNFPATMDMTNISVILDDEFFEAYHNEAHPKHKIARHVYWTALYRMVETAEPGFSIDVGPNAGETLRNACTEITSRDDSDVCNLGSVNMARVRDINEFEEVLGYGTQLLVAGTLYSDVPYDKVKETRAKNRRLGMGLMGIHEWLMLRGKPYGPDKELGQWLEVYERVTNSVAHGLEDWLGISRSVKTRAIAPTGTIGIIAETTTGIEPIFCSAYKRRYLSDGTNWKYQYVVDPTAKRMLDLGVKPGDIEDAYGLSYDVERRVNFQAWVQGYVDHGISSTINLPAPLYGVEADRFGTMLIDYLPFMRGVTCYPDGARSGQPLSPVDIMTALEHKGVVFEENEESCVGGVCGI